jgi:mRNA-degrading endonuclease RelE of RelBE toxin-antitoxin system
VSATQVYYSGFDAAFLKLPAHVRARIQRRIDEIGLRLATFPHHPLKGSSRFRARAGDDRIIYTFDLDENKIHLLAIGHRREIYRP